MPEWSGQLKIAYIMKRRSVSNLIIEQMDRFRKENVDALAEYEKLKKC